VKVFMREGEAIWLVDRRAEAAAIAAALVGRTPIALAKEEQL
jgi:hypothetical protein